MGLWRTVQHLSKGLEKRAASFAGVSLESAKLLGLFGSKPTSSGVSINAGAPLDADQTMRVATVFSCVRLVAETVAGVPLILYRRMPGGGKERATEHPLYRLLHDEPNEYMTPFEFREMEMISLLLRGNSYSDIEFTGSGVRALHWVAPDKVRPFRSKRDGLVYYEVLQDGGGTRVASSDLLMHVRGISGDGVVGYNPIQKARENIGLAIAQEEFGARLFSNNANFDKAFVSQKPLNEQQTNSLREQLREKHAGLQNSFVPMVLSGGLDVKSMSMTMADAQFLESRKFQAIEIARMFRVPPHKVGIMDRATFNNIESQNIEFVTDSILPWCERLAQRYNKTLLTPTQRETLFFEHELTGLLRGDSQGRANFYRVMVGNGIMSRNEVRARENLPAKDGADELTVQSNQVFLDQLEEIGAQQTQTPESN